MRALAVSARCLAVLLAPLMLTGCLASDDSGPTSFIADANDANQPFPANYRAELVAFMHTYLNNPVGVHDAVMADPVRQSVSNATPQ